MSQPKHTPGPWSVDPESEDAEAFVIFGPEKDNGWCSLIACLAKRSDLPVEANAARIVACVNACEGIADPSVVPKLLETLKMAERTFGDRFPEIVAIIARAEGRS